jgi:hypothetical protein
MGSIADCPRGLARLTVWVCLLTSAAMTISLLAGPHSAYADPAYGQDVSGVITVTKRALDDFMGLAPNDPRSYARGVWTNPNADCWWCLDVAATAAGTLSEETTPPSDTLLSVAKETFNNAIEAHQTADGSWDENAIDTGFFAVELGESYYELQGVLDPATLSRWANSFRRAVDYIINQGELTWYINGNDNLRQAGLAWMAWKITGDPKYETDFQNEWNFTLSPPQPRWAGFGLHLTRVPTRSDGADGAGYLAEADQQEGGAPGFDPEYTMTQLDTATEMWVMSHDARWLRLMNLFFNQLRPRIDSSFVLDAEGGSRHNHLIPFYSGGLAVLYHSGDRPDLAGLIQGDLANLEAQYTNTGNFTSQNMYRGLSGWLGMIILDYQHPQGLVNAAASNPGAGAPPQVTVAPMAIATDRLATTGLQVTARNLRAGATVRVELEVVRVSRRHRVRRVLVSVARRARRKHRVRVGLRVSRRVKLSAYARAVSVKVIVSNHGRVTTVITRTIRLR